MNRLEEEFKNWIKWNASTLFLLKPITGIGVGQFCEFGLVNSYLEDVDNDIYVGDYLLVLLKPNDYDFLEILIDNQDRENINFVGEYDYEGGWVVLVYSIPEKWKEDFTKFKDGRYSALSEDFKSQHDKHVIINMRKKETIQYLVFYKDTKFKKDVEEYFDVVFSEEDELWEKPLTVKETLNISKIKEKLNEEVVHEE